MNDDGDAIADALQQLNYSDIIDVLKKLLSALLEQQRTINSSNQGKTMKRICKTNKLFIIFLALLFSFVGERMMYAQCSLCYPLKNNKNETYKIGDEWKVDYTTKDGIVTKVTKRVTIYRRTSCGQPPAPPPGQPDRKKRRYFYSTVSYGMLCPANSSRWHPANRFCNCCSHKAFGFTSGSSSKTPDLQQPQQPVKETQKQQCAGHIWQPAEFGINDLKQNLAVRRQYGYVLNQKRREARRQFEKKIPSLDLSLEYGCVIFLYNNSVYLSSITPGNRDFEACITSFFSWTGAPKKHTIFRSTQRIVNGEKGYYLYDSNDKWDRKIVKMKTPFEGFGFTAGLFETEHYVLSGSWSPPDVLDCPELNLSIARQDVLVLEVIHSHPEKIYISNDRQDVDKKNVSLDDFTGKKRSLRRNIFSNTDLIYGMKNGCNVTLFNVEDSMFARETTFDPSTMQYLMSSDMKSPIKILKDGLGAKSTKKVLKCSECGLEIQIY